MFISDWGVFLAIYWRFHNEIQYMDTVLCCFIWFVFPFDYIIIARNCILFLAIYWRFHNEIQYMDTVLCCFIWFVVPFDYIIIARNCILRLMILYIFWNLLVFINWYYKNCSFTFLLPNTHSFVWRTVCSQYIYNTFINVLQYKHTYKSNETIHENGVCPKSWNYVALFNILSFEL